MLKGLRENEFRKKKVLFPFAFFYRCLVAEICAHVSFDCALVPLTLAMLTGVASRFRQLYLNVQAQSVCVGVDAQLPYSGNNKCCVKGCLKLLLTFKGLPRQLLGCLGHVLFHESLTSAWKP